jgi:type II secretory pathway pseudopilin PulG
VQRAEKRGGAVLLEVIVALTLLSFAGAMSISLAAEATAAVRRARSIEKNIRAASDFLSAVSLWTRGDLDRHMGSRPQGTWIMSVQRPEISLYEVLLSDSGSRKPILETVLFRPIE